jgi:hypothetical protein
MIHRGAELLEAALKGYRDSVVKVFTWSLFASFTENREEAEEYKRVRI